MKILELEIAGLYRFENCSFNFYTKKKINNLYRDDSKIYPKSNIYPKDINIIIGGNASGKTTLSKAILTIERLINGFSLSAEELTNFKDDFKLRMRYLKNDDANSDNVFEYLIKGSNDVIYEQLSYGKFNKGDTLSKKITVNKERVRLLDNLELVDSISYSLDRNLGLQSQIMRAVDDTQVNPLIMKAKNNGYNFSHHEYGNTVHQNPDKRIDERLLGEFLRTIDHSIIGVEYTKDDKCDFYIKFNSGDDLLVNHDNISYSGKRLSYGTVEAIIFLFKANEILSGRYNTIYIDENLSHIQSELEKVLLLCLIQNLPSSSQLFFTTHNTELLKINLPVSCYTVLSENTEGNTEVTHVEEHIESKNDRNSLYKYIRSNYFETEKYYDELFDIFEGMADIER